MKQEELKHWLLLHHTPGIGPAIFQEILRHFDSASSAYHHLRDSGQHAGLKPNTLQALRNPDLEKLEKTIRWNEETLHHIITFSDSAYPQLLREIPDPPAVLYAIGEPSLLKSPQIGIVGSRNPSPHGKKNALQFAKTLSQAGLCITSGLALGVDSLAHQGALAAKGQTIAVTGTGLDKVYPARHRQLAHEIVNNQGLILSEFPLGTPPKAENFPRRNRIISGLSLGTLVVEAALQSGSLITARTAGEQGRDVFAIPGSIHNPLARGCHQVIRQGAKLVETAEHILEELGHIISVNESLALENTPHGHNDIPQEALELLEKMGFDPISIDELVTQSGLTPEAISSILLVLELHGCITSLQSGQYTRIN